MHDNYTFFVKVLSLLSFNIQFSFLLMFFSVFRPFSLGTLDHKRVVALASAIQQAEFLDNLFDTVSLSSADRSTVIANLEMWRKKFLVRSDSKALYVEQPVINAVLAIFIDKD